MDIDPVCYDPDRYYGEPWYADDHIEELEEYFKKPWGEITDDDIDYYVSNELD